MLLKLLKLTGLDWRVSAWQRYWFYFTTYKNYMELIQYERSGSPLRQFTLRNGQVVQFQDANQAMQMLLEIWRNKIYTKRYKGSVPKVVVDIGANVGLFSIFAHRLWPESDIYAYEPEKGNFAFLKANVEAQKKNDRFHIQPAALSSSTGELTLFVKEHSGWHSVYSGHKDETPVTVQSINLPSLVNLVGGKINFLKMDCEGCEWHSILHHAEILKSSVEYIAMEYHELESHTLGELVNMLKEAGFECSSTGPDAWKTGMLYAKNNAHPSR